MSVTMKATLRIGSRPSKLAIVQAEMVRGAIADALPDLAIEIVPIKTSGDKILTPSLAEVGGKGLFIKELEQALAERRVDIAVHSMKDLPAVLPAEFRIAATPPRENPHDALITSNGARLKSLPKGAKLGPRRRAENSKRCGSTRASRCCRCAATSTPVLRIYRRARWMRSSSRSRD